jgi:hypothetical protein
METMVVLRRKTEDGKGTAIVFLSLSFVGISEWHLIHKRVASLTVVNVINRQSTALTRRKGSSASSTGRADGFEFAREWDSEPNV